MRKTTKIVLFIGSRTDRSERVWVPWAGGGVCVVLQDGIEGCVEGNGISPPSPIGRIKRDAFLYAFRVLS